MCQKTHLTSPSANKSVAMKQKVFIISSVVKQSKRGAIMTTQSLASKVWNTLSAINVNDMTEKKGNLTYLSWASAVEILNKHFPDNEFATKFEKHDDGTVMTYCQLVVRESGEQIIKSMWLPVMDHRNNAIPNPDARKISDTMMRCLAKTIAMCGLGLYVYRGEDLPTAEVEAKSQPISTEQFELLMEGIAHSGIDLAKFTSYYKVSKLDELPAGMFDQAMDAVNKRIAANAATEQA